jgi:urease accessory protein UreF
MMTQTEPKTTRQEVQLMGEHLLTTVKRLIHEGNVRRIIIITQDEQTIAEFPLTVGVATVMLAPMLAAVGAISALLNNCTIEVERIEPPVEVSA